MELKEYQITALKQVRQYLETLNIWRDKYKQVVDIAGKDAAPDFPLKTWETVKSPLYNSRKNGLGDYLPNFCLKIPTGGGKTLLAVKTIDLIQSIYLNKKTGMILWIVPSDAIYRQTIKNLKDHDHPYRQHLDLVSGGKTIILEKTEYFTPDDVAENLVVMMLMLPSAWRENRETLRLFRDNGGFTEFFPAEDDINGHLDLLKKFPNLDVFNGESPLFPKQIKTSLGNALRILSPIIILDEGHKAYGENSQKALYDFNPSIIVELSATPLNQSNSLVDISGMALNNEGMIKLDLHIVNKASVKWEDTLLSAISKRNILEEKAKEYEANAGRNIRPICLIQVERTGKDQKGKGFIHADDVREYLIKIAGVPEEYIAVKTSEKDDIEGIDLLAHDCPIRYIITKQALQEGWDCSFAYVLVVLTNPASKNNLTQLVGRVLRQPYATKTKITELDESYVFCFQQSGVTLMESVRKGLMGEGLGDLTQKIVTDEIPGRPKTESQTTIFFRDKFKQFTGNIYLPVFTIKDKGKNRRVNYESDIVSRISWQDLRSETVLNSVLSIIEEKDVETAYEMVDNVKDLIRQKDIIRLKEGGIELDYEFMSRHLMEIIPNPWIAYEYGKNALEHFLKKYKYETVKNNFVFIIEQLKKNAESEKERLAEQVFRQLIKENKLQFLIIRDTVGLKLPDTQIIDTSSKTLTKENGQPLQRSLFDFVPEEDLNTTEQSVAWYLEEQEKLLWWYRNISRQDYYIQGWRKHKIYPDFIFTEVDAEDDKAFSKVFVVETKGLHLKNEDTAYKQSILDICNDIGIEKSWDELGMEFPEKKVIFKIVYDDEWQARINELFNGAIS
jgi:type III restriction enzyme